jgi:hypothetical protein
VVVWAACTTAFFGSFRLGEILELSERMFDPPTILRWSVVKVLEDDTVLNNLRNPKGGSSEFVDIFKVPDSTCCF